MGVDYRSGVAKGYIIPGADLHGIAATKYEQTGMDGEIMDYLYDKDYLICLNAYISQPEYILGYDVCLHGVCGNEGILRKYQGGSHG